MDHRRLRFPDPVPRTGPYLPEALRDPVRLTLLGGLLVMAAGAVFPWIRGWTPAVGAFEISGFERAGDAGLVLELGALAWILTWSDRAWHSRLAILAAGPFVLSAVCVLVLRVAYGDATSYLRSLERFGGYGSVVAPFWIAVVGAVLAALAGGVGAWRARGRVSYSPGITVPAVAGSIGGVLGAVGGFVAGVRIAGLITAGTIAGVSTSVLVLLAFSLAFAGAWIGAVGAASLARTVRRP